MEKVEFIHVENGDDIIISFSCEEGSTFGVDGFIMHRTPKYEFMVAPDERGACTAWGEDDIRVLVDQVYMTRNDVKIITRGKVGEYHFDINKISDKEYDALIKHFRLINFDNSIRMEIAK